MEQPNVYSFLTPFASDEHLFNCVLFCPVMLSLSFCRLFWLLTTHSLTARSVQATGNLIHQIKNTRFIPDCFHDLLGTRSCASVHMFVQCCSTYPSFCFSRGDLMPPQRLLLSISGRTQHCCVTPFCCILPRDTLRWHMSDLIGNDSFPYSVFLQHLSNM